MKETISKVLRVLGYVYVAIASALLLVGIVVSLNMDGFVQTLMLFNPFNVFEIVKILLFFAPGLLMLWGSKTLCSDQ